MLIIQHECMKLVQFMKKATFIKGSLFGTLHILGPSFTYNDQNCKINGIVGMLGVLFFQKFRN